MTASFARHSEDPITDAEVKIEQTFLGAALIDQWFCNEAIKNGSRDLFGDTLHQRIFDAMCELHGRGETVTPLTIRARMADDPGLKEVSRSPALEDHRGCYLAAIAKYASAFPPDPADLVAQLRSAKAGRDAAEAVGFRQRAKKPGGEGLETVCAADVLQTPVEWLWPGRIARGKMTLIAGDPGLGKSQTAVDVIARVSRGTSWPDGERALEASCIILSAEDAPADTICPRLDMAGADLKRVHILRSVRAGGRQRSFSLQSDLELLGEALSRIGDVGLVLIDPITAYLGDIDSHRTTDVRSVLEPLDKFAEEFQVAILAITHPTKASQSKALHSFTGSLAFVAAARLAFIAVQEPETGRSLLLAVKNNLGPSAAGLGYTVRPGTTRQGIPSSHIVWDRMPVTLTANEALRAATEEAKRGNQRHQAKAFLKEALADGPLSVDQVRDRAEAAGISKRTLDRARAELGIIADKSSFAGGWMWRLP